MAEAARKPAEYLAEELIPLERVREITGMGTTFIYEQQHVLKNPMPRPIKIGRRSLWVRSEIHAWVDRQIALARGS